MERPLSLLFLLNERFHELKFHEPKLYEVLSAERIKLLQIQKRLQAVRIKGVLKDEQLL